MAKRTNALKRQTYKPNGSLRRLNLVDDFSGGLNTASSSSSMLNNQVRELSNFMVSGNGALSKRPGTAYTTNADYPKGFKEVLGFINLPSKDSDIEKYFYIMKIVVPNKTDPSIEITRNGLFTLTGGSNTLTQEFEELRFYVYEENNEEIDLNGVGKYVKKFFDATDPIVEDYEILGKTGNFQSYNNIVYWKVGTKLFQYPINGGWQLNEDGGIYVNPLNGSPVFIPESDDLEAKKGGIIVDDTFTSTANQFWIEVPKQIISSHDLKNKGVNLLATNPSDRVLTFLNSQSQSSTYSFRTFKTPLTGTDIRPNKKAFFDITDKKLYLYDYPGSSFEDIYGGNGAQYKDKSVSDWDEATHLTYWNRGYDEDSIYLRYWAHRKLDRDFTTNQASIGKIFLGTEASLKFQARGVGSSVLPIRKIRFNNTNDPRQDISNRYPPTYKVGGAYSVDGWVGELHNYTNQGYIRFNSQNFHRWSGIDLTSLGEVKEGDITLDVFGSVKTTWWDLQRNKSDTENSPYYDNNIKTQTFKTNLKKLETLMIKAFKENKDGFFDNASPNDSWYFYYSKSNIRSCAFTWVYALGSFQLDIWPIEFLNLNNVGINGATISRDWASTYSGAEGMKHTLDFEPHYFSRSTVELVNPADTVEVNGKSFTSQFLNSSNFTSYYYFNNDIKLDFFDFKDFVDTGAGDWGIEMTDTPPTSDPIPDKLPDGKDFPSSGLVGTYWQTLQGDLDGLTDQQAWYKDIKVDISISNWKDDGSSLKWTEDGENIPITSISRLIKRHLATKFLNALDPTLLSDNEKLIRTTWLKEKGTSIGVFNKVGFKMDYVGGSEWGENNSDNVFNMSLTGSIGATRGKVSFYFDFAPTISGITIRDQFVTIGEQADFSAIVNGSDEQAIFDGNNWFSWNIKKIQDKVSPSAFDYLLESSAWGTTKDLQQLSTTIFEEANYTVYFFKALTPPPKSRGEFVGSDPSSTDPAVNRWLIEPYLSNKQKVTDELDKEASKITFGEFFDWGLKTVSLDFTAKSSNLTSSNELIKVDSDLTNYDFLIYNGLMLLYSKDKIWISDPFNFGYFPKSYLKQLNLGGNETERQIQTIKYYQNVLIVFTNEDIHVLKGTNPLITGSNPISINKINNHLGAVAPNAVVNYNNKIIFMSSRGIYALISIAKSIDDNWNTQRLDNDIKGVINYSDHPEARAVLHNDSYYLFLNGKEYTLPINPIDPGPLPDPDAPVEVAFAPSQWFVYNESYNKKWFSFTSETFDVAYVWSSNGVLKYIRKYAPNVLRLGYSFRKEEERQVNGVDEQGIPTIDFETVYADDYSPGYNDGVILNSDGTVKVSGAPIVSTFKTKSYDFEQPLNYKKYKKVQLVTENYKEPTTFVYDALIDGVSTVPREFWSFEPRTGSDPRNSGWRIVQNERAIGEVRGFTSYDTTFYYDGVEYRDDVTTNKNVFRLNNRGRNIQVFVEHSENNPIQFASLGLEFKLKKAK